MTMSTIQSYKDINRQNRIVIDFSSVESCLRFTLGRVKFIKAHHPLENHIHPGMMEFVYIAKGSQVYTVCSVKYTVNSGDLFVTFPDELHSSGNFPEEKSVVYYLIVDFKNFPDCFIGYNADDKDCMQTALLNLKSRKFKGIPSIKHKFDTLIDLYYGESPLKKTKIRNTLSALMMDIIECENKVNSGNQIHMNAVTEYIHQNIYEDISVPNLASIAGMSVSGFKAKFRKELGVPPREYVLRQKIELAKALLRSEDVSITEIAHRLSFSSSQYFSAVFKRFTFKNPTEFKY